MAARIISSSALLLWHVLVPARHFRFRLTLTVSAHSHKAQHPKTQYWAWNLWSSYLEVHTLKFRLSEVDCGIPSCAKSITDSYLIKWAEQLEVECTNIRRTGSVLGRRLKTSHLHRKGRAGALNRHKCRRTDGDPRNTMSLCAWCTPAHKAGA